MMYKPYSPTTTLAALACFALPAGYAAAGARVPVQINDHLQNVEVAPGVHAVRATVAAGLFAAVSTGDEVHMNAFPIADGVSVDLELAPFDVLAPGGKYVLGTVSGDVEMPRPQVTLLQGGVANEAGSSAYLAVTPAGVQGWVETRGQIFVVARDVERGDNHVAISPSAALPVDTTWRCAVEDMPPQPAPALPEVSEDLRTGGCWTANIAIDTDNEYLQLFGGNTTNAAAYITTLFGAIDSIYQRDLKTHLVLPYVRIWTTTDPWNQSDIQQQLYQFRDYWNANMTAVSRTTAHLISGRNLGGGIAFLYALCGYSSGAGVSGNIRGTFPTPLQPGNGNWDVIVVAHELGHNFGSPHTHCYNPPIDTCYSGECYVGPESLPAGGLGTLMSYCHTLSGGLANIDLSFHPRCNTQIQSFLTMLQANSFCDLSSPCTTVACNAADVNCDGTVNGSDIMTVRAPGNWGKAATAALVRRADVNKDGNINGSDIASVRAPGTWNTATGTCTCN